MGEAQEVEGLRLALSPCRPAVSGDIGACLAGISLSAPPSSPPARRSRPVSPQPGEQGQVAVRRDEWRTVTRLEVDKAGLAVRRQATAPLAALVRVCIRPD